MITGKTKERIRQDVREMLRVEQERERMAVTYQASLQESRSKEPKPEDFEPLGWKEYATMRIVR